MIESENQLEILITNERKKNPDLEWKTEYKEEEEEEEELNKKFRNRIIDKIPKLNIYKKLVEVGDRIVVFWGEEVAKGCSGFYKGEVVG